MTTKKFCVVLGVIMMILGISTIWVESEMAARKDGMEKSWAQATASFNKAWAEYSHQSGETAFKSGVITLEMMVYKDVAKYYSDYINKSWFHKAVAFIFGYQEPYQF